MKKILLSLAVMGMMVFPFASQASVFQADEVTIFSSEEAIEENVYLAGASVYVDAPITGELFVAGSAVNIDAEVNGDVFVAGGHVVIDGTINGDLRVAAASLDLRGEVTGEVLLASGLARLLPGTTIAGGARMAAGELHNASNIEGEVKIIGEEIYQAGVVNGDLDVMASYDFLLEEGAQVQGMLRYAAPEALEISEQVALDIQYKPWDPEEKHDPSGVIAFVAGMFGLFALMKLLGFILAAVLLAWWAPNLVQAQTDEVLDGFWYQALRGFVIVLLLPVLLFILAMTGIGSVVAAIVGAAFSLMAMLAGVHACVSFGMWLRSLSYPKNKKHDVDVNELTGLLGAILLGGIALVPVIGWLFVLVWWLASLGAICTRWYKWLEAHRG